MCFSLFGILFVCSFVTWPILFAIIPLSYLYLSFKEYYLASSRELTRLNGITRAPIIEHFSESVPGPSPTPTPTPSPNPHLFWPGPPS